MQIFLAALRLPTDYCAKPLMLQEEGDNLPGSKEICGSLFSVAKSLEHAIVPPLSMRPCYASIGTEDVCSAQRLASRRSNRRGGAPSCAVFRHGWRPIVRTSPPPRSESLLSSLLKERAASEERASRLHGNWASRGGLYQLSGLQMSYLGLPLSLTPIKWPAKHCYER